MAYTKKDVKDILDSYQIADRSLVPHASELIVMVNRSEEYSGSRSELFVKNGVLYENHGSHCSCHGFEEQWKPEVTYLKAIRKRPDGFEGVKAHQVVALARAAGYNGE